MSNVKISALPAATTPLAGTEVVPIVQAGVTAQVAVSNFTSAAATPTVLGTVYGKMTTSGASPYLTALGYNAGVVTTGVGVTAVGAVALASNTSGTNNTAVGYAALNGNTTGISNTATGRQALDSNSTGSYNTAIGHSALTLNTTSSNNTAVGYQALYSETTAGNNTAIGYQAGRSITTGTDSVFIGYACGYNATPTTNGNNNVFVGPYCHGSAGNVSAEYLFGFNLAGKGNATFFVDGSSGAYNSANTTTWSTTSDQRLKKNIVDNNVGLDAITSIHVRNFEYRLPEEVDAELKPTDAIKKEGLQLGVIAQELQLVLPDCVKTESTGVMSVNADNLTWYLVNAIKELSAKVAALENK